MKYVIYSNCKISLLNRKMSKHSEIFKLYLTIEMRGKPPTFALGFLINILSYTNVALDLLGNKIK